MTREEYNEMCLELIKRGYKRNFGELEKPAEDGKNYYYKVIERREDEDGDSRAVNQLFFYIWHLEKYRDITPLNSLYSLEPIIMISRNVDERIDLHLSYPEFSIDECEEMAVKFGKWSDENIKENKDL